MYKKIFSLLICIIMALSFAGCQNTDPDPILLPQLSPMKDGEDIAVITTNMGVVKLRFFPESAPKAVENFITHSKDGYYDGVIFHRVIKDFMIQSGDPLGTGQGGESIWGGTFEVEADPRVRHIRGAVAMANTGQPNSNGSQFYIVQNNTPVEYMYLFGDQGPVSVQDIIGSQDLIVGEDDDGKEVSLGDYYPAALMEEYAKNGGAWYLDFSYTVFAQVYEGMDVVDEIAAVKVDDTDPDFPKPLEDVIIESIKIEKYKNNQ